LYKIRECCLYLGRQSQYDPLFFPQVLLLSFPNSLKEGRGVYNPSAAGSEKFTKNV
jgi:hypothetical protein